MFGYITPMLSELKMKDYERFRSYYCGLCFSIKNKFGNIPRVGLNYDTTFFAVLMDGLSRESSEITFKPCIKHPFEKREYINGNKAMEYATDLNLSLVYYKLLDDKRDDKNIKSIALTKVIQPYHKKITFKNLDNIIKDNLDKLHSLESSCNFSSLDEVAHPFSYIIGKVLEECPFELNEDTKEIRHKLYDFGYFFGKWIYILDALDDLKDDMKNGKFNPIAKVYNNKTLSYDNLITKVKANIDFTLMTLASNCSELLKELPIKKNNEIIDNVINLGLIEKYMNISSKL
ncbi:DUF5685 family protein [Clostridium sp. LP20]|uniref:DUF5685 family protein n=1 Tax=Clostridium sp. LP20 TaxID=3418665 RepID=UPI003EE4D2BD